MIEIETVKFGGQTYLIRLDNGDIHNENGPASIAADGTKKWYRNNLLHRENGPAVETASGSKFWYVDGKKHRVDGPASEFHFGTKRWYIRDILHRVDGPAVTYGSATSDEWYVEGKRIEKWCNQHNIPYVYNEWPTEYKILWKLENT